MSSASQRPVTHNIVQKSFPGVKGSNAINVTTSSFTAPRSSIITSVSSQPNGNLGNIITVATSQSLSTNTVSTPSHYSGIQSTPRPRVKTITTRAKAPLQVSNLLYDMSALIALCCVFRVAVALCCL